MVCNGEIYNAPTLRKQLEKKGYIFKSNSDNEVILHGYHAWGKEIAIKLEGMFAFAVWNNNNNELYLARDGVGIKPLAYTFCNGGVAFASDLGALSALLPKRPSINPLAMGYILTIGYVPAPHTIWQGIHKLPPGHYILRKGDGTTATECFWEPPREIDTTSSPDDFTELFHKVVDEHMLADVPMGLFLSGGLDSSAVAAALHRTQHSPEAIILGFTGAKNDERKLAREVASNFSMPITELLIESTDIPPLLLKASVAYDEPQAFGGLLPLMQISKAASEGHRCVLSGDGGDEVFRGYKWYRKLPRKHLLGGWRRQFNREPLAIGASPKQRQKRINTFRNASILHDHVWRLSPRFLPEEVQQLLSPHGLDFDDETMLAPFNKHYEKTLPLSRALQRIDLMTFCSDSILPKVDRASMWHSLEVRVPFLDRRVINYGLRQPVTRTEKTVYKPTIRNYLKGKIPESVLSSPKQGFSLQTAASLDWHRVYDSINNGRLVTDGHIRPDWGKLPALFSSNRNGCLYGLWSLSLWLDQWQSIPTHDKTSPTHVKLQETSL